MAGNNKSNKRNKRGLASADQRTRERVSKAGGEAYHEKRGATGSDDNSNL